MGGLMIVYGAWQLFRWPSGDPELISDLFFVPAGAFAAGAAWKASRRCHHDPRLRWAWRLLALASASYLAGNTVWTSAPIVNAALSGGIA